MKKYLLTSLLGLLAFVGFTSAGFESNSEIISVNLTNSDYYDFEDSYGSFVLNTNTIYTCVYTTNELPFYLKINGGNWFLVENQNSCVTSSFDRELNFEFMNSTKTQPVTFNGTIYASSSQITYVSDSSSGGGSSSDSDSSTLLPNGFNELTPVVTGVSTIVGEFIPYVIYCSIGILLAILGFVAIKRLMNYMTRKITSIFSSKRRK